MASVCIRVNADKKVWSGTLYVKHLSLVELYGWMLRFQPNDDGNLLAISFSRHLENAVAVQQERRVRCDLDAGSVRESHFWYSIRVLYSYQEEKLSVEEAYSRFVGKSIIDDMLIKVMEFGEDMAALSGALPARRMELDDSLHLNERECESLNQVVDGELLQHQKEYSVVQSFHALLMGGVEALTVEAMRAIANVHQLISGHWTIYCDVNARQALQTDRTWNLLLKGILWGKLSMSGATSISFKQTPNGRSINIGNPNCLIIQRRLTEEDRYDKEVVNVDWAVRVDGYKGIMKYKADVFSACQILHYNQFCIRPTIFKSEFDSISKDRRIYTSVAME